MIFFLWGELAVLQTTGGFYLQAFPPLFFRVSLKTSTWSPNQLFKEEELLTECHVSHIKTKRSKRGLQANQLLPQLVQQLDVK